MTLQRASSQPGASGSPAWRRHDAPDFCIASVCKKSTKVTNTRAQTPTGISECDSAGAGICDRGHIEVTTPDAKNGNQHPTFTA